MEPHKFSTMMNVKKKFVSKVLDGLRYSVSSTPKSETEIEESLRDENFQVAKTVRHGFPYNPTCMAYDPVQHIFAVGTKSGSVRIFGRPGVDCHTGHPDEVAVIQILFLINEGAMITVCSDDTLHLWNLRQKRPDIVHSLRFQRERITFCHLPFQSKWLYIGTERGNVHIVNIEKFELSGYVINWNKAIELSRKTHPGPIVHLSDCPIDPNKLLIGFESGAISLWDLKTKTAEQHYGDGSNVPLKSVAWHHEGKQFMCSHTDGSLTTWNIRIPQKASIMRPHAKLSKDNKPEPCRPISKLEWKTNKTGEQIIVFSGGMSYDKAGKMPSITVMHGKSTTVLEMEHQVVEFFLLCDSPYNNDTQDPQAIVVLLQNDLVVVDLTSPGYPCYENPYPMDIHESPVTACQYYADCPSNLVPAFYSVGHKQKKSGFSEKDWPIQGGEWGSTTCSYPEIVITGHADGSLKFWDASSVTLQVLYKLKTAKLFEKHKHKKTPEGSTDSPVDEDPFAIQHISLDLESRILCVAGYSHLMLFRYSKQDASIEFPVIDIAIQYEIYDEIDSPEIEFPPPRPPLSQVSQSGSGSVGSYSSTASDSNYKGSDNQTCVKVKGGPRKQSTGYQPDLVCLLTYVDGEAPAPITSMCINSSYGLLAFGNECGLAVVDIVQKICLWNMGTPDLYGSMDPYQRAPRSPKVRKPGDSFSQSLNNDECKSPSSDQSPEGGVTSPNGTSNRVSLCPDLDSINESGSPKMRSKHPSGDRRSKPGSRSPVNKEKFNHVAPARPPPPRPPPPKSGSKSPDNVLNNDSDITVDEADEAVDVVVDDITVDVNANKEEQETVPIAKPRMRKKPVYHRLESDDELRHELRKISTEDLPPQKLPLTKALSDTHAMQQDASMRPNTLKVPSKSAGDLSDHEASDNENETKSNENNDTNKHSVRFESPELDDSEGKGKGKGFLRRMSVKMRDALHIEAPPRQSRQRPFSTNDLKLLTDEDKEMFLKEERDRMRPKDPERKRKVSRQADDIMMSMLDLRSEDVKAKPRMRKISYATYLELDSDKTDSSSFSRSRSSSMSSLENITKEAIQCIVFADSFTRKTDSYTSPSLWVGTSLGSVLVIALNLPPSGEQRLTQPVMVSPSGTIFRLKGTILAMSFLDCNGGLIPTLSDTWKDNTKESRDEVKTKSRRAESQLARQPRLSPTSSTESSDRQFAVICSEKQARVMSLPSQTCTYKVKITDVSFVTKADVVTLKDAVFLACFLANGHIMTFSLPSLRPLMDCECIPVTDIRIARTFTFSNNGHALYFTTPSELQKVTLAADVCVSLNEMLGDLFLPCETPEAPKQGFFKNLFNAGPSPLDREMLFGPDSGKAAPNVTKYIAGTAGLQASSDSAMGAVSYARQALDERGQRLGELSDVSERMREQAQSFQSMSHDVMLKYKNKKWYQL
ncbi:unnamed protein product [Owenia fusiformis]|uniref:Uncharacterized protein n=1 Tax=Owenia fusiformis TaxID=6347 RepID=A0A8J1XHK4_OWEFU|nr:unnamed protein product [Owenia fusiformis]